MLYKGEKLLVPGELLSTGYTHKIRVLVQGVSLLLEPDEERNYRAVLEDPEAAGHSPVDRELVQAVIDAVEAIVK